jgi:hypothetical protein
MFISCLVPIVQAMLSLGLGNRVWELSQIFFFLNNVHTVPSVPCNIIILLIFLDPLLTEYRWQPQLTWKKKATQYLMIHLTGTRGVKGDPHTYYKRHCEQFSHWLQIALVCIVLGTSYYTTDSHRYRHSFFLWHVQYLAVGSRFFYSHFYLTYTKDIHVDRIIYSYRVAYSHSHLSHDA